MRLHYKASGSGPPVVLLHGLFGSADNWHPVAQRLADRHQVFALDQRNHGQSPHDEAMDYRLMAGDVCEFFEDLGLERAVVIGHSMGGKTAMQFALQYPEKVEKLVVEDMAPRAYPPAHEAIFEALLALDLPRFQSRAEIETALAEEIPPLSLRRFLLKNLGRNPEGTYFWKLNLRGIANNYQRLRDPVSHPVPFEKPALFVRGGKSRYLAETDEALIRHLFPGAMIRTIAESGHWIHAEQLEAFLALLCEFL